MLPPVITTIPQIRATVAEARRAGKTIGLAPTMGALHSGHASLIRAARIGTGFTVVSIFVNPAQFGPSEDLDRYPRTLEADRALCGAVGADVVFAPSPGDMYPDGFSTYVEVQGLGDHLCGPSRPGHFRGVATIVLKLFNIVLPDAAYFGQKDAQQARIIQQMARDLDLLVDVKVVPTVREPDGLAMSSRNRYLSSLQRWWSWPLILSSGAEKAGACGGRRARREQARSGLTAEIASTPGARLDYARPVDVDFATNSRCSV